MKNFTLTTEEIQQLRIVHKSTRDKWAADRIKTIIALGGGHWTLEEVSEYYCWIQKHCVTTLDYTRKVA